MPELEKTYKPKNQKTNEPKTRDQKTKKETPPKDNTQTLKIKDQTKRLGEEKHMFFLGVLGVLRGSSSV